MAAMFRLARAHHTRPRRTLGCSAPAYIGAALISREAASIIGAAKRNPPPIETQPMLKPRILIPLLLLAAALVGLAIATGAPIWSPHGALPALGAFDPSALSLMPLAMGATKSKFFRVATEGATTDGRTISREWIDQMAKTFDRAKYGARVWLEHYRGIAPDGLFKAYGDVISVEARTVEDGKKALFAQIEPLPDLVAMNKAKQKIYTSIEVDPKFAGTGEAYLVGLAVTDSPASIGTEVLQFAAQHPAANPFSQRKASPDNLITAATEVTLEFEDDAHAVDDGKFATRIKDIVAGMFGKKAASDDTRFAALQAGLEDMAKAVTEKATEADRAYAALQRDHAKVTADLAAQQTRFADLVKQLDQQPGHHTQRPPATGGAGAVLTDC